jgi:hypothetical protein
MNHLGKWIDATNINTVVTIIGIFIGVPSFYIWARGYMDLMNFLGCATALLTVLIIVMYLLNKNIIKQNNEKDHRIESLGMDVATWKDQSAKWQDKASLNKEDAVQWKDDCEMLFEMRNELKMEIHHLQEELRRVYESHPSSNPRHSASYSVDTILRESTAQDMRLIDIDNRLHASN